MAKLEKGNYNLKKDVIVYKKCWGAGFGDEIVLTLLLVAGTRVNITRYKCRAAKAFVICAAKKNGQPYLGPIRSMHKIGFIYTRRKWVKPDTAFDHSESECASGIHFFQLKSEATKFEY